MSHLLDVLHPLPWRPGENPPPLPQAPAPPLLLLIACPSPLPPAERAVLLANLSHEEHRRHGAYRRPADQDRFLVARASLRQLLGHWLGLPPGAVPLETSRQGKPHCPCPGAPSFNVSHSGDLILLGFHPFLAVGVDVEQARPTHDWVPIARRVLAPAELTALLARPAAEQASAFLAAWCQLEARLKARGEGLAGLERLREEEEFGVAAPQPALLWDVAVPPGYAAAAALHTPLTVPRAGAAGAAHPNPPA